MNGDDIANIGYQCYSLPSVYITVVDLGIARDIVGITALHYLRFALCVACVIGCIDLPGDANDDAP